jgi:hypothetical protein
MTRQQGFLRCAGTMLLVHALSMPAPAAAATVVRMSVTAQLQAGMHVRGEMGAEFQLMPRVPDSEAQAGQVTYRRAAKSRASWEFEVPPNGRVPERRFDIEFPADLGQVPHDSIGVMTFPVHLWLSFGADAVEKEYTFAVPYPAAGTQLIDRCVRISGDIGHLGVETAPDCKDESFLRIRQHAVRIPPGTLPPGTHDD